MERKHACFLQQSTHINIGPFSKDVRLLSGGGIGNKMIGIFEESGFCTINEKEIINN